MIMIELEALNWSFQLLLYIRHDFGHVKSRRQTSFSSCIQSYCSLVPRSSNGFCRCFAFQIGKSAATTVSYGIFSSEMPDYKQ